MYIRWRSAHLLTFPLRTSPAQEPPPSSSRSVSDEDDLGPWSLGQTVIMCHARDNGQRPKLVDNRGSHLELMHALTSRSQCSVVSSAHRPNVATREFMSSIPDKGGGTMMGTRLPTIMALVKRN